MAVIKTKTITGSTGSPYWTWKIIVSEETGNPATMESPVVIDLYLGRTSVAGGSYFGGSCTLNYSAGGLTHSEGFSTSYQDVGAGGWFHIGSHRFIVSNAGGPNTISVSGSMSGANFSPNWGSASGSITLEILHTPPIISNVEDTELNNLLDNNYLYQYLSKKRFKIYAEAYDGESITEYNIYIGNTLIGTSATDTIEVDFRQAPANIPITQYTSGGVTYGLITFEVKDTLSSSRYDIMFDTMFYDKPNLTQTSSYVKRNGQTTGKAKLTLLGTFYNKNVGTKTPNIITLSYKYWATNASEPSTYFNIPFTATTGSNNISISNWNILKNGVEITDVDKQYAYYFKVKAIDSFNNTSEITLLCTSGEWLMAKFKNRVDFKKITIQNQDISPYVLYSNDSGTAENITLSDNISNYNYVEIYYGGSERITSKKIKLIANTFILDDWYFEGTTLYAYLTNIQVSGNNLTILGYARGPVTSLSNDSNFNKIYRIVGYK